MGSPDSRIEGAREPQAAGSATSKAAPSYECSARIVLPFVRLMRRYPNVPPSLLEAGERLDPDERLPFTRVVELLAGAVTMTGDADLGLKAAREITPGEYGAFEYVVRSAANWGEAIAACGRYLRLVHEAAEFSLRVEGDLAYVRIDSKVPVPRASMDFEIGAFYRAAVRIRRAPAMAHTQVWFMHPRPANTDEYARTFEAATLRFDAPWNGFVFDRSYLYSPLATTDPKLHDVIRKHAEMLLSELPKADSLTEQVRALVAEELKGGDPTAAHVARKLHMSVRTLGRRLEQEGATFSDLLDDLRRRLALRYVGAHDIGLAEIAFLLGFSQSGAFHRAFRRWTGQTPLEYRKSRRG